MVLVFPDHVVPETHDGAGASGGTRVSPCPASDKDVEGDQGSGQEPKRQKRADGGGGESAPPPLPRGMADREHGAIYQDSNGQHARWDSSKKKLLCCCDGYGSCRGGAAITQCAERRRAGADCAVDHPSSVSASLSRVKKQVQTPNLQAAPPDPLAVPGSRGTANLLPGQVAVLKAMHVVDASRDPRAASLVVLEHGTWNNQLAGMNDWVASVTTLGGGEQRFPLRAGAVWRRNVSGKHAAVVGKASVTLIFEIKLSLSHPEKPVISVRDYDLGAFGRSFSSPSLGTVELEWLSQGPEGGNGLSLTNMRGKAFAGLNNPNLAALFSSWTPGFEGFREGLKTRGPGEKEVGARQQQRRRGFLTDAFEALLGQACTGNAQTAFNLLQGASSYKNFVKNSSSADDNVQPVVAALVTAYAEAKRTGNKMQARFVLSIYSQVDNRGDTMAAFGCTEYEVKQANMLHRLRRVDPIEKLRHSFGVFSRASVDHFHDFSFRPDNLLRAAFSNRACMRFLLYINRNRMYLKYKNEAQSLGVKPIGKTTFYRWYSDHMFQDMQRATCACTQCVDYGDVFFDSCRSLVHDALPAGAHSNKYINAFDNLQHFFERYYRGMLVKSSEQEDACLTLALSRPDEPALRCACNHEHVAPTGVMRWDETVLSNLRRDIVALDKETVDVDDFLWRLDTAEHSLSM